ncbi:MAG TPA: phosphatidate cytidylyltransferase [Actinomycetota bacterium]|nr:phosphatidate cytidylyltransferase [Actinomycetota bacterium]
MGEGDKPEGADDLFEDLDKFFAPIKDVDWPDPDAEAPLTEPEAQEEHVAVHGGEPEAESEWEPQGACEASDEAELEAADEPDERTGDGGTAEAVWYDTEAMDAIEGESPIVIEEAEPSEVPGQAGLFAGGSPGDEAEPEEAEAYFEPTPDPWVQPEQPSEEDVEAAAEHFAESIRSEDSDLDEEPEPVAAAHEPGDLLSGIGADAVEEDILSDLDETGSHTVKVGTEGLGGPSWQEPTSMEVGADLDRQGGRDVPAAFATGLILAAAAFGSLLIDRAFFAVVAALIILVAQGELFGVMHKHHKQPATGVGLVTGALILWGAYDRGEGAVLAMVSLGAIATLLWFMAVPAIHRKDTLVNVGLTVFNIVYIPVLGSFLLLTLALGEDGEALVAAVIALTFIFDTIAFLAGATFGGSSIQRPLAPDTSPKKSWEGLLAATLVTIIVSVGFVGTFVEPFDNHQLNSFLLGLVVSLAATFGDLAESLIKRDLGIKDMGSVLPGHGGVLDRIDSLLFTAPAAFFLFRVLFS